MRVLVAANLTPYLRGGADAHILGLTHALRQAGHDVECLRLPFAFNPNQEIRRAMGAASVLDLTAPSGQSIDRLVSLQFPAYGVQHPHHVVWVMHQHRAVYELFQDDQASSDDKALKAEIESFDEKALRPAAEKNRLFANSKTVADRLIQFNGLSARPLYHPPPDVDRLSTQAPEGYVFFPSRFESLKRQLLLIEAAQHLKSSVILVLAGEGGQYLAAQQRVSALGLSSRVKLLGRISDSEKILWYAKSLAVCYPTKAEDYGYVTLEAMASGKPVITCTDSGGPTEFVQHNETGLIVAPDAKELAAAIDSLYFNQTRAIQMGNAAKAHWQSLGITWSAVVDQLLSA